MVFNATFLNFTYSEKVTKFCEISTVLLSYVVPVKSKVEILQNFAAFSEYVNFNLQCMMWIDIIFEHVFWVFVNILDLMADEKKRDP